ncbi:TonB-dependent siderophore receptor [Paracoccus denitrificans]|uniref:TonB-dependent siderophore receptor n=1 Tax=Paracoccus denitrificans TaxID=266 RepID=UPI000CEBD948|nr:TonB-dependent receptor plug domain-containing protein [Paracoccus denitrificans]
MAVRARRRHLCRGLGMGVSVLALVVGALLPAAALAETVELGTIIIRGGPDEGKSGKLAKVASGGTKTETPLVEVPQSVSVVTETAIRESGVTTIGQALAYSPGLFASPAGGNDSARYDFQSLRGQGYNGALFLDGMRGSFGSGNLSLPQFDPFNLERIEVIRGPSSVLYGQGLPGGLINAVTKRPTGGTHRELAFTLGSENRRELRFDLGGSSRDGSFDFRLAGLARAADNRIGHVSEERFAIAPSLRWNIAEGTSLTFFGSYQHDPEGGYYGSLPPEGLLTSLADGRYIPRDFFAGEPDYDRFGPVFTSDTTLRHDAAEHTGSPPPSPWRGSSANRRSFGPARGCGGRG